LCSCEVTLTSIFKYRKRPLGRRELTNSLTTWNASLASLRSLLRDPTISTSQPVGGPYVNSRLSGFHLLFPLCDSYQFLYRELKRESYGVELLQTIGFVYVAKAKHHLATNQSFLGVGGWLHNVQGKYLVFSETYANRYHLTFHARLILVLQCINTPSSHRAQIGV